MTEKLLYLGGPSAELPRVCAAAGIAENVHGWTIVEPWWLRVEAAAALGFATDADVPDEYMAESARRNEDAIQRCVDAAWRSRIVFLGKTGGGLSGGCAYELGLVKGLLIGIGRYDSAGENLPVYLVGDPRRFIGIWEPPQVHVIATLEEALA